MAILPYFLLDVKFKLIIPLKNKPLSNLKDQPSSFIWVSLTIFTLGVIILFYLDYQKLLDKEQTLKTNILSTEAQLSDLPKESLNSMPWTLGYRSPPMPDKHSQIELEIKFREKATIDSIIILPATYTVDTHQLMAFGFPKRFYISNLKGDQILVDYRDKDYPSPGIEPQIFNLTQPYICEGIKLVTTELVIDATWWSQHHNFSLSEIYVFSDYKNVALNSEATASHHQTFSYIWNPDNLVDGFSLFSPVIRKSIHPLKYTFMPPTDHCMLLFENKESIMLDEVRLWPVIHSLQHNYPPSSGLGFPKKIRITSSNNIDFKNASLLYESPEHLPKPGSNPFCIPIQETNDRYFLFDLSEPLIDHRSQAQRISLAEIEWLNRGRPVSSGNWHKYKNNGSLKNIIYLNDGYSNEGKILPLKESLIGLNLRAKLEKELNMLKEQFSFLDGQKNEKIRNLFIVGLAIIIILGLIIILIRIYAQKKWHELRESIAADLHDEVGANLSSIGQYNDLIKQSCADALNEQQLQLFDRAINTTRETSQQTRHLIQFLEQKQPKENISTELKLICQNILPPITYTFHLETDPVLNQLKPGYHWHFLMFFKEAINNIRKHAEASIVEIHLKKVELHWVFEIEDNGIGFNVDHTPPLHLQSRAQKLNANLTITSNDKGTKVALIIQNKHIK